VTVGLIRSHQIDEVHYAEPGRRLAAASSMIPMGPFQPAVFSQPSEAAAAVPFLASYVTGRT
jgi:hypothetical protein